MIFVAIIFSILTGYVFLQSFASSLNIYIKVGLSFIIGIGMQTFLMFIFSLIGFPFSGLSALVASIVLVAGSAVWGMKKNKNFYKPQIAPSDKIQFTFAWFLLSGLIIYLLYAIVSKALYWPIAEYDSMTGYDLMGKMIAKEGTFKPSIFSYPYQRSYDVARFIYPPLVASGFGYFYAFGADNAKIYIVCLFLGFVISFYGLLRNSLNDTFTLFFTLLAMITPEMFSHVSLGLTNLPNAIYTSLSFIAIFYYFQSRDNSYFIISLVLMALSMWSRSDSIVFVAGYGLLFLIDFFKSKQWLKPGIYLFVCFSVFMIWTLFVKINIGANSSEFFVKKLFWDGDKFTEIFSKAFGMMLGSGTLYGLTFYVFVVFLALNIIDVVLAVNKIVVFAITTWVLYTLLYYQIDYSYAGSIDAYLNASYKRGLFNFVPLAWFFVAVNPLSAKWLQKLEAWYKK